MKNKEEGEVFTRLFAAFSTLFSFTSARKIIQYLDKLLHSIPGVSAFIIHIHDEETISDGFPLSKFGGLLPYRDQIDFEYYKKIYEIMSDDHHVSLYPIRTSGAIYGFIIIYSESLETYLSYDPAVSSFSIAVSTILENIYQKNELEGVNERLENTVQRRTRDLKKTQIKLRKALDETIEAVAITVELRDPFTAGHQYRVASLSQEIAIKLGLKPDIIHQIYLGAMIHDIGKIQVPAEILTCPVELTPLQFDYIKTHPWAGYAIIKEVPLGNIIPDIVLHHHERLNGTGYPHGLKGRAIPLPTRIVSVADVFEAMISHRPYRPARSLEETLKELRDGAGSKYDRSVVQACIELITLEGYQLPSTQKITNRIRRISHEVGHD